MSNRESSGVAGSTSITDYFLIFTKSYFFLQIQIIFNSKALALLQFLLILSAFYPQCVLHEGACDNLELTWAARVIML